MKTNNNTNSATSKQDYNKAYNSSWAGRLRSARQYSVRTLGCDGSKDTLTVEDLERLEKATGRYCPCCGEKFDSAKDMQISHWVAGGNLTANNTFLSCFNCNNMQRSISINFLVFKKVVGTSFLKYFQKNETSMIEHLNLSEKDVKRIWNRINQLD